MVPDDDEHEPHSTGIARRSRRITQMASHLCQSFVLDTWIVLEGDKQPPERLLSSRTDLETIAERRRS